jgi:hypothetical protein
VVYPLRVLRPNQSLPRLKRHRRTTIACPCLCPTTPRKLRHYRRPYGAYSFGDCPRVHWPLGIGLRASQPAKAFHSIHNHSSYFPALKERLKAWTNADPKQNRQCAITPRHLRFLHEYAAEPKTSTYPTFSRPWLYSPAEPSFTLVVPVNILK